MKTKNTKTMKTTTTKTGKGILLTTLLVFSTICLKAEESNMVIEMIYKNMSGIYIIGAVLGFGLVLLAITKIASRYSKDVEVNQNTNRVNSHRHKHHQRIIKKSS